MDKYALQQRLGYFFTQTELLDLALTHRSKGIKNNERLEFLGDSLLSAVISETIYRRYPEANEGRLSRMRAHLVRRETLARQARQISLPGLLQLGKGELKSGGQTRESLLADTLEALLAAIYLDSGSFHVTAECIHRIFADLIERLEEIVQFKDPKSLLQEWLQARHEGLPVYKLQTESADPKKPFFTVSCKVSLLDEAVTVSASNKRHAEQQAAAEVLEKLSFAQKQY